MFPRRLFAIVLLLCFVSLAWSQDNRQAKLRQQRKQLQQEIKQINTLLFSNTKKKKTALNEVEDLALKIDLRQRLIRVTNEEANRLTQQINVNQRTIDRQRKELEELKADYADMIRYSYASKSGQSRLMFLFSSESFYQAYKRFQYLKQYTAYRKKQGEQIAQKTQTLQALNKTLFSPKNPKRSTGERKSRSPKFIDRRTIRTKRIGPCLEEKRTLIGEPNPQKAKANRCL